MHLIQLKIVLLTTRPTTRGHFDSRLVVRFSVLMSLLSFYMLYLLSCYKYLNLFGGFALSYHKYEIKLHIRKPFVRKDCWRRNIRNTSLCSVRLQAAINPTKDYRESNLKFFLPESNLFPGMISRRNDQAEYT